MKKEELQQSLDLFWEASSSQPALRMQVNTFLKALSRQFPTEESRYQSWEEQMARVEEMIANHPVGQEFKRVDNE